MKWDRFEILGLLGEGGMGRVWRARDHATGELAAVKELRDSDQETARRFSREIELLGRVAHPNVIRLVAVSPDSRHPAYAMEFCEAGDLDRWLSRPRTLDEKLACLGEILAGLEAIHRTMIHRDIKPGNVLLGGDGRFRISDFGLGRSLRETDARITTRSWYSRGFSAPEQQANMRDVDERADVYSAGAVLHFMLTGRDCTLPPDLADPMIPAGLRDFLARLLALDPGQRLSSVSEARRMLGDVRPFFLDPISREPVMSPSESEGP